jgi:hypothetical protein
MGYVTLSQDCDNKCVFFFSLQPLLGAYLTKCARNQGAELLSGYFLVVECRCGSGAWNLRSATSGLEYMRWVSDMRRHVERYVRAALARGEYLQRRGFIFQ